MGHGYPRKIIWCMFVYILLTSLNLQPVEDDLVYIRNGIRVSTDTFNPQEDFKTITAFNQDYNTYTDYANGFQINYPKNMKVDFSLSAIYTAFTDQQTQLQVFYDNFNGTTADTARYIMYGNRFVRNTKDHTVLAEENFELDGTKVHTLKWMRPKLSRIPNDKNHYVSAEIIKNAREVYTIFIKSSDPIDTEKAIINSFRFFTGNGPARNLKTYNASKTNTNQETSAFFKTFFVSDAPLHWGIFEPLAPENTAALAAIEKRLDYRFYFVLDYQSLDEDLPLRGLQRAYSEGRYVELTFYTAHDAFVDALSASNYTTGNASIVYEILDGKYDDYLEKYARDIKAFGHPILFRLNNEMNGDWCWYSAYYTCKDADLYKALWKYIYGIFERNRVDNVLWVWNPHDISRPDFKWNHYLMYYPGDEYVDIIGLTGYNTGTYFTNETWREFSDIYKPLYTEYRTFFAKPFIITEFGSNSVGGDKAVWLTRMFDDIKSYENIKVCIWWNGIDYDRNHQPARIYKLDENDFTTGVFKSRLKEFR